ncbi:MAG: pyruvate, phosphate dikinase, partial [Methanobacteriota archaeon]
MAKSLYFFDEGDGKNKRLLGGKGAGLCTMAQLGLPVPSGFVITTEVCKQYYDFGGKLPDGLMDEVTAAMRKLEEITGKRLGDPKNPLLVSIRSGSMFSMPGMMDTILNLGLNDETVEGMTKLTNNERFAYDAYRRFIQMFGKIVLGIDAKKFEEIFDGQKAKVDAKVDTDLNADDLKNIVKSFKQVVKEETGKDFPTDPFNQLKLSIGAVFSSWKNKRAIEYRRYYKIPDNLGTAVNVVTMVFGNIGSESGTGVAFTRDPSTGNHELFGEFLFNAQGEDVVAGIRTPLKIIDFERKDPEIYKKLIDIAGKLERHYRDMQDVEFTVEAGKLFMLQTRAGKRTAQSALKIAVDMVEEGLITKEEALLRVEPSQIEQLLHKQVDPKAKVKVIAKGLNASPGAAVGKAVFDSERAKEMGKAGDKVILVRPETSPDDVGGIIASQGVLTSRGGVTSHAAVVTRGMGKPAVVGCESIKVDSEGSSFEVNGVVVKENDLITINGST